MQLYGKVRQIFVLLNRESANFLSIKGKVAFQTKKPGTECNLTPMHGFTFVNKSCKQFSAHFSPRIPILHALAQKDGHQK